MESGMKLILSQVARLARFTTFSQEGGGDDIIMLSNAL